MTFLNHRAMAVVIALVTIYYCSPLAWGQNRSRGLSQGSFSRTTSATSPGKHYTKPDSGGVSTQTGLALQVTIPEYVSPPVGYRTYRLQFDAANPVVTNQSIRIVLYGCSPFTNDVNPIQVEAEAEIAEGEKMTTVVIHLPVDERILFADWEVWVNGKKDDDLSHDSFDNNAMFHALIALPSPENPSGGFERYRGLWVMDARQNRRPDLTALIGQWEPFDSRQQHDARQTLRLRTEIYSQQLPEDWIDYSSFDCVLIDPESLAYYADKKKPALDALRRWLAAGGTIWIDNVGSDWEELAGVEQHLGIPESTADTSPVEHSRDSILGADAWHYVNLTPLIPRDRNGENHPDGLVADYDPQTTGTASGGQSPTEPKSIYSTDWFAVRSSGWGTVVAFTRQVTSPPANFTRYEAIGGSLYLRMADWEYRHGLNPAMSNSDFSNWLIPGVGTAPALEFQALITLFVLIIGPLNYWLLRRAKRLNLLVLTVPIIAMVTTLGVLLYGLIGDGFGTRVRAMSFTYLDQQRSEAATWSRLSYYASFAPSGGLSFDDDNLIYPILPGEAEAFARSSDLIERRIRQDDSQRHLTTGWLASRTPTQFLSVASKKTDAKIIVRNVDGGLAANNQLGSAIPFVLFVDDQGAWYSATDVPASGSFRPQPIERVDAVSHVRDLLGDRRPELPNEILAISQNQPQSNRGQDQQRGGRDYGASFGSSLLQRKWDEVLGFGSAAALSLPRNTYLVISHEAILTPLGLESVTEESSAHLILGSW